ncbi:MAG: sigma-70 family RNA polymerase sigma factor [Planctomycetota bacterium]
MVKNIHADRRKLVPMDQSLQQLMKALIEVQPRLYAYVTSLVHDLDRANDVLQKANVVMLEKLEEFKTLNQEFVPWAFKVCYFEVLADRRDALRDQLAFDDSLLDSLAASAAQRSEVVIERQRALTGCLEKLTTHQRDILSRRYENGQSVATVAKELKRPTKTISQTLYRIHEHLLDCIERRLAAEGHA